MPKLDEHGLPFMKPYVRYDSADKLIARKDLKDGSGKVISKDVETGHVRIMRFGSTPGNRWYNGVVHFDDKGNFLGRKIEVQGHIKGRDRHRDIAKVVRERPDSFLNGICDLGSEIEKSYTTPNSHPNPAV